ncbi:MAG: SIMPL domain-containing protein [Capsulimonas sp.]|uniref:SIMPL domain-containing protein n=1 Tax=Capsulimonas sp. TaxID=2494211 RepID=UPI003267E0EE
MRVSYISATLVAASVFTAGLGSLTPASAAPIRSVDRLVMQSEGITSHGHAETKVKPDVLRATLGVTTISRNQADAVSSNAARVKAVLAALHAGGVTDKDIQTQYYTVQPQYDYKKSPAPLTGYQVSNSIQVTIRDLTKGGVIIDQATKAGATDVNGLAFDLSDRKKAEGAALVAAVANARSKADLMAGASGVSLGRLISLDEGGAPTYQPVMFNMRAGASDAAETTPIVPQEIVVTADVTIVYDIDSGTK